MAIIYCNDDGSNTSPYETWAKAATTFLTAVDAASAGDDIYIGADHSETPGSVVYTFPGTAASPNRVVSVTVDTTTYNKADNTQIDSTSTDDMTFTGFVKIYGMEISVGDDLFVNADNSDIKFDDCVIILTRAGSAILTIGTTSGKVKVFLKNTELKFGPGDASAGISIHASGEFSMHGGKVTVVTTQPTTLFTAAGRLAVANFAGVDLSDLTGNLVAVGTNILLFEAHHCLLNSSVTLTTGTLSSPDTKVLFAGCDDTTGNNLYRLDYLELYGTVVDDDAIFVTTGGASDGTTPISTMSEKPRFPVSGTE